MKKNDAYIRASSGMPKKPGQQKKYFKAAPTNPAAGQHLEAMNPRRRASAPVSPAEGHQQEDSVFGSTHPRSPASASASPAAGQQLENVNPRRHAPASVSPGLGYLMDSRLDETSSATSAVLTGPQMFVFLAWRGFGKCCDTCRRVAGDRLRRTLRGTFSLRQLYQESLVANLHVSVKLLSASPVQRTPHVTTTPPCPPPA